MALNFDLTDVAAHAAAVPSMTGIQRVQIEYARRLFGSEGFSPNIFADFRGAYVDLGSVFEDATANDEAIFRQIRRLFQRAPPFSRKTLTEAGRKGALKVGRATGLLRGATTPGVAQFELNTHLYVGGAFWAHPRSVRTYEHAASRGCNVVVLFHDVLPIVAPGLADAQSRPLYERMLRLNAQALAVSQHSKSQIEEARRAVGAPDSLAPVRIVPLAHEFSAAPRNFSAGKAPSPRVEGLDRDGDPFVLCVGTVEARKNQLPLLRLWERLTREMGPGWPRLVVAGKSGWRSEEAVRELKRGGPAGPFVWIDTPTDDELAFLYARARFTVFPSLAEGWGLPIGESLWFGKPVVASNVDSIPEVGGTLCAYADPRDIESFAAPIIRLVRDGQFYDDQAAAIRASRLRTWRDSLDVLLKTFEFRSRTLSSIAGERETAI